MPRGRHRRAHGGYADRRRGARRHPARAPLGVEGRGDAHHLRPWRTLEAREPPAAGDLGDPAAHGLDRRLGELRPAPRPLAGPTPCAPVRPPLLLGGRASREGAAPCCALAALWPLWET